MKLKNQFYQVEITCDETYTLSSADNKFYDFLFNPFEIDSKSDYYKTLSIQVKGRNSYKIAFIGGYHSYTYNCAILEDKKLVLLQNEYVFVLDLENVSIILNNKFDEDGCNFAIYRIENGYVIYGELNIIKLDSQFNKVWSFSGRDVFVDFQIDGNYIKVVDFLDNNYILDFDGKEIKI